jgi:hypothetical protein
MFRQLCGSEGRAPTEPRTAERPRRAPKKPASPTASSKKKPRHARHASGALYSKLLLKQKGRHSMPTFFHIQFSQLAQATFEPSEVA